MVTKKQLKDKIDYHLEKLWDLHPRVEKVELDLLEMKKSSAVTEDRVNRLDVSHAELSKKCKAFNYSLFGVAAGIGAFVVCSLSSLIFCRKK